MPTSPYELMTLAKRMQAENSNEAALRCAISRSYYAALLLAGSVFPQRGNASHRQEGSHEQIIDRAVAHGIGANPGRTSARVVGKLLPKMKRARVIADYALQSEVTSLECDEAIQWAETVLQCCEDVTKKLDAVDVQQPTDGTSKTDVGSRPALTRIR